MDRTSGPGLLRLFKKSAEFDSEFSHNGRSLIPPFSLPEGRRREKRSDWLGPLSSSRGRNVLAVQLLVAGDTEPFMPIVPDKVFKASSLNCFEITVAPGPRYN